MKRILVLFGLIMLFSIVVSADIRPPITPKPSATPQEITRNSEMYIAVTPYVDEPVLVISKAKLAELNAAANENGAAVLSSSGGGFGNTQTIVGGLFLSFAFVFAGVWLARNNFKPTKTAVGVVVFALLGMTATFVTANIPPPKRYGITPSIFSADMMRDNAYSRGNVKVVIADGTQRADVQLLVPEKKR